jgi:hypothetical protein
MADFEVPEPILNSAFEEPAAHWRIRPHELPQKVPGRRPAVYFYRDPRTAQVAGEEAVNREEPLENVNLVRAQLAEWRRAGYPGVTRTTLELLRWWRRDGRQHRLFFAQLEAAETILFLKEARADLLQGIDVPWDEKPGGGQGLKGAPPLHLILETKGYDPLKQVKAEAAERWVKAVNADGTKGRWAYRLVTDPRDVTGVLDDEAKRIDEEFRGVVRDVMERHAGTLQKLAK